MGLVLCVIHFRSFSNAVLLFFSTPIVLFLPVCDLPGSSGKLVSLGSEGIVGTPSTMAPELMRGSAITNKIDIYSFAVVTWEVFCRARAWQGVPPMEVRFRFC